MILNSLRQKKSEYTVPGTVYKFYKVRKIECTGSKATHRENNILFFKQNNEVQKNEGKKKLNSDDIMQPTFRFGF